MTDNIRYWTAGFDYETWGRRDPHRLHWGVRPKLVATLAPGDIVFGYVARIGWTAVWRCTSGARVSPDESMYGDEYPTIAAIEPIIELDTEHALSPRDLPQDPDLRQGGGTGAPLPFLYQSSGRELPTATGEKLLALLETYSELPSHRSLTSAQREYSARSEFISTKSGTVFVPSEDESVDEPPTEAVVTTHSEIQAKLLDLGRRLGLNPWVTPGDQSRPGLPDGTPLGALPGVTTTLPEQFDAATTTTIRNIDVMWLDRSRIEAAFEVEHSTSIYSGILRMADLLALQPNLDIPLYLVVPDERLERAKAELLRPVFRAMQRPLPEMCRVLTYSAISELVDLADRAGGALRPNVLDNVADRAEP